MPLVWFQSGVPPPYPVMVVRLADGEMSVTVMVLVGDGAATTVSM